MIVTIACKHCEKRWAVTDEDHYRGPRVICCKRADTRYKRVPASDAETDYYHEGGYLLMHPLQLTGPIDLQAVYQQVCGAKKLPLNFSYQGWQNLLYRSTDKYAGRHRIIIEQSKKGDHRSFVCCRLCEEYVPLGRYHQHYGTCNVKKAIVPRQPRYFVDPFFDGNPVVRVTGTLNSCEICYVLVEGKTHD